VPEKATRRRFSAEYKRGVLEEADACSEPGEVGALLRREGLYSSHLSKWRQQRERGTWAGLQPKKRGPKPKQSDLMSRENERLRRENQRLRKQLLQAEAIIDIQKRASEILGISLESPESGDDE
jgi:transposase-like protein